MTGNYWIKRDEDEKKQKAAERQKKESTKKEWLKPNKKKEPIFELNGSYYHSDAAAKELEEVLAEEIAEEIDREIIAEKQDKLIEIINEVLCYMKFNLGCVEKTLKDGFVTVNQLTTHPMLYGDKALYIPDKSEIPPVIFIDNINTKT